MKNMYTWGLMALLLAVVGCDRVALPGAARLEPRTELSMGDDGQAVIRVGATNTGTLPSPADNDFKGVMELRNAAGELSSKIEVYQFRALEPQETDMPSQLMTLLDPGVYRLTWTAPAMELLTLDFEVLERDGTRYLRADSRYLQPFTNYTIAEPPAPAPFLPNAEPSVLDTPGR